MRDAGCKIAVERWRGVAGGGIRASAAALRLIAAVVVAMVVMCISGCATTPTTGAAQADVPEKIRVRDLASRTDPAIITGPVPTVADDVPRAPKAAKVPPSGGVSQNASIEAEDAAEKQAGPVSDAPLLPLVAQVVVVPRDDPRLGLALTMIGDLGLEPGQQHLWHKNGFRIGQISRESLTLFMANLPKAVDVNVTRMQATGTWNPVTLVDKLRGVQRLRAFDATDQARPLRFLGGEYQMLIKMLPPLDGAGPAKIELMPHHFAATSSLIPRSPEQKVLDGMSFEDLAITQPIGVDKIWVITARVTAPAAESEDADKKPAEAKAGGAAPVAGGAAPVTGGATAAQPVKPGAEPEIAGPRLPSLAQALFTGKRGTKNTQMILIIGLEKR